MRRRSDLQTKEPTRQMPIGKMHNPIHRTPGFYFAIEKPCSDTEEKSDNDVLRKNSPSEWNQHYEEFIKRPEPDQLGIVEVSWD